MKNNNKTTMLKALGSIVFATLLIFSMTACDDGIGGGGGGNGGGNGLDRSLNGTWVSPYSESVWDEDLLKDVWIEGERSLTFNNGSWEYIELGYPSSKGTYTTQNHTVTQKITHAGVYRLEGYGLDKNKWYTMAEIKAALGDNFIYFIWYYDPVTFIAKEPYPYSINGNTLYLGQAVYTRQ